MPELKKTQVSGLSPHPSEDVLIKIENVSKKFCRNLKRSLWYGMKDMGNELIGRPQGGDGWLRKNEFWAVKDVSFELKRGECLGLIGRNGAGKTTLLRMLNGLIKPDRGRIEMCGRVGALIALGAGFNPILTGRENIYVNAAVLGLNQKETDARFWEIVEFADLAEFIDSPVQSYSSGMQVRLGFAIATSLNPDILLLDEVLAVGDAAFRNKCYNRIGELRESSATIFVTHSVDQVSQFCDRVLVLSEGHAASLGDIPEGIAVYESLLRSGSDDEDMMFETVAPPVTDVRIALDPAIVSHGKYVRFRMEVDSEQPILKAVLRIVFYDPQHCLCVEWNSGYTGYPISLKTGTNIFQINLGPILLKTGKYRLAVVLTNGGTMVVWSFKKHEVVVNGFTPLGPPVVLNSSLLQLTNE